MVADQDEAGRTRKDQGKVIRKKERNKYWNWYSKIRAGPMDAYVLF